MAETKDDISQLFMLFIMALTRDVNDFRYNEMKIGRLIFIVNYIGYRKECRMKDILEYLNVKASTATKQLDRLVGLKLVKRIASESDRRNVLVTLTKIGWDVYDYHKRLQEQMVQTFIGTFTKDEIQAVTKVILELTKKDRIIPQEEESS